MILKLDHLLFLGILTASTHWIVARSAIAKPFWSRMTGKVDALLRCAGCSGWWLGLAYGAFGIIPANLEVMPGTGVLLSGLLGAWLTPVFEGVFMWGLARSSIPDEPAPAAPPAPSNS